MIGNGTCFFSGHRRFSKKNEILLKKYLKTEITVMIRNGFDTFLTGGADGFDTLAAEAVMEIKETNPQIELVIYSPFPGAEIRLDRDLRMRQCRCVYTSEKYHKDAFKIRNYRMVDDSQAGIVFCLRPRSGTGQTIRYAEKKGIRLFCMQDYIF